MTLPMFEKIGFVICPVKDMARACAFYEETLGLARGSGMAESGWVEYDLPGGGCLALTVHSQTEPSTVAGATIAFEVADLDALTADLAAKGVTVLSDLVHGPACRMRVVQDSEGNGLLLHQLNAKPHSH